MGNNDVEKEQKSRTKKDLFLFALAMVGLVAGLVLLKYLMKAIHLM